MALASATYSATFFTGRLDGTTKKFGAAQISDVVGARSALLGSQIAETQARAAYARARVALDQVLGETLEKNHVSLDEGLNGRVKRESRLPTQ